jgi:plastocyanin
MARRNLLRSLLAASVMVVSGTTGLLVAPAGAAEPFEPDYRVTVYETKFSPATIFARPTETVQFDLGVGVGTNHTVTLENGTCGGRPTQLCERNFDDPNDPPIFRFSNYGEYRFYDRIAREAGQHDMGGVIIIMDNPPPTTTSTTMAPSTTSTTLATTTTTRPITTTTLAPTSTTTAPSTIRPFVISAPTSTTTTTAAPASSSSTSAPAASGGKDQSKGKNADRGHNKDKPREGDTSTTTTPGLPGGPIDVVFDEASLTPLPDPFGGSSTPDSLPEEAALVDLLSSDRPADDESRLLFVGIGVLTAVLLIGGIVAWGRRSSRYFPA